MRRPTVVETVLGIVAIAMMIVVIAKVWPGPQIGGFVQDRQAEAVAAAHQQELKVFAERAKELGINVDESLYSSASAADSYQASADAKPDVEPTVAPTETPMIEKDLYKANLREEYYAEVARREAAADLEVKGITEPREIGITHEKGYVAHVAHAVVTFPDGSSVSIPWMGGENIVRLDNLVGDTIVATFSAYPETGWTLWEYAPGIVPNTAVQAAWPLGNKSHCGLDAGCPMTREWYISWTGNGVVFNLVREYKLSAEGELIFTDLDPTPFLTGAIAVHSSPSVAAAPAVEVPAESVQAGPKVGEELDREHYVTVDGDSMSLLPPAGYSYFFTTDNGGEKTVFYTEEDAYTLPKDVPTRIVLISDADVAVSGVNPDHVWTVAMYGGVPQQKVDQLRADQANGGFSVVVVRVVDGKFVVE